MVWSTEQPISALWYRLSYSFIHVFIYFSTYSLVNVFIHFSIYSSVHILFLFSFMHSFMFTFIFLLIHLFRISVFFLLICSCFRFSDHLFMFSFIFSLFIWRVFIDDSSIHSCSYLFSLPFVNDDNDDVHDDYYYLFMIFDQITECLENFRQSYNDIFSRSCLVNHVMFTTRGDTTKEKNRSVRQRRQYQACEVKCINIAKISSRICMI